MKKNYVWKSISFLNDGDKVIADPDKLKSFLYQLGSLAGIRIQTKGATEFDKSGIA